MVILDSNANVVRTVTKSDYLFLGMEQVEPAQQLSNPGLESSMEVGLLKANPVRQC